MYQEGGAAQGQEEQPQLMGRIDYCLGTVLVLFCEVKYSNVYITPVEESQLSLCSYHR